MTEWGDLVAGLLEVTRCTVVEYDALACERVASYLYALLDREPLKSRPAWEAERVLLGTFAWDLREIAVAAGEPVGAFRDLRDAKTKQEEREARERVEAAARGYDAEITAAIEADRTAKLPRLQPEPSVPVTPIAASRDGANAPWR